ncbi:hypothetical protein PDESU_05418 [Pontiella desulfatans]|uniref:SH3b domain-containing protein n=1 Tax=Pontiella desulfatans TaxID=2750659 RepID=A0A6C2UC52_PONDE|nr:hypothetical protein [Pontiella desulfatans]VGO16826.1 hypothetical protein PDESU_05418 [Pontiella desulfatans]
MKSKFPISIFKFLALLTLGSQTALAIDYRLTTLETAQGMFRSATNSAMYAEAARQFDFLVHEEGIRNGHLFYTVGNCWFMANDVGRAILNYRRAEQYMPNHADLKHNLMSALELRTDLIPEKEPHPLAANLLGWHINTPTTLRWWLFAFCWLLFWGAWFWMERSTKKEARVTALATGLLSAILLASLLTETFVERRAKPGVVVAKEVLARKGDGNMYAPAFLEPLHSGTEFKVVEDRQKWWHIQLADGQTCWIPANAAETVALK